MFYLKDTLLEQVLQVKLEVINDRKFSNLYKSLTHKKMKKFNLKSKKLLTSALFLTSGLTILSHSNQVKASACPDASSVTSPNGIGDASSFIALSEGSCYETPEEYGVTIYKMGLCTSDPKPTAAVSYTHLTLPTICSV